MHRFLSLQVTQVQLETLKMENQHLTEMLEKLESRLSKVSHRKLRSGIYLASLPSFSPAVRPSGMLQSCSLCPAEGRELTGAPQGQPEAGEPAAAARAGRGAGSAGGPRPDLAGEAGAGPAAEPGPAEPAPLGRRKVPHGDTVFHTETKAPIYFSLHFPEVLWLKYCC